jgi:hypothetical protein
MGAINVKDDGTFTITYGGKSAPFGGLDTSAPPTFISPNGFTAITNFLEVDNALVAANYVVAGTFPLGSATDGACGIYDLGGILFELLYSTFTTTTPTITFTINSILQEISGFEPNLTTSVTIPNPFLQVQEAITSPGAAQFKTINGICYIVIPGIPVILQFDNNSLSVLTSYLGAAYIAEFNGRLIVANTYETQTDGKVLNYPFKVAWSAAQGAYGIWAPLDPTTNLVTGAGYNFLPDVEDYITGFLNVGTTLYVFRTQGITEMTALSSGIQPFDFSILWASHKGIGAFAEPPIVQYGSAGYFVSDTDIYTFGYNGLQGILGAARSGIFPISNNTTMASLTSQEVSCSVGPLLINNNNDLCYIITQYSYSSTDFPGLAPTTNSTFNTAVYKHNSRQWFNLYLTLLDQPQPIAFYQQTVNTQYSTAETYLYLRTTVAVGSGISGQSIFYHINSTPVNVQNASVVFPAEDITPGINVNIESMLVYLFFDTPGDYATFSWAGYKLLDGDSEIIPFINVTNTVAKSPGQWGYFKVYPLGNPFTGTAPQLTVTFNGTGQFKIGQIVAFGNLDPQQEIT